jgi:acyl carrier protein
MESPMNPRETIRGFVKNLLIKKGDTEEFGDDTSLIFSGRLSSVDVIEIAVFLEEKCHVNFAELGFDQAQIDTVEAIVSLMPRSE